jgi:hypothetical protein
MLQRYLNFAHPQDAKAKFMGGLTLVHQARQLTQLTSQRLPI